MYMICTYRMVNKSRVITGIWVRHHFQTARSFAMRELAGLNVVIRNGEREWQI